MKRKNLNLQKNVREIMAFAIVLTIAVGFLILSLGASAQNANTAVVVNSETSGNMRMSNGNVSTSRYMSNGNAASPSPTPKSSVRGRVVYENTGRPVRRASIMLLNFKGGGNREGSGLTDNNGAFEIKNVGAGKYYPMINAPGIVTPFAYFDVSEISADEARQEAVDVVSRNFEEITVNGETDTEVLVRAKQGGAIGGRVFYADGDPAIGIKVEVMRKSEDKFLGVISSLADFAPAYLGGGLGGGKTDDRGVYRIAGLPPGDYVVRVSEPATHNSDEDDSGRGGYLAMMGAMTTSLLTTYHPNASDAEKADVIKLELGQEAAEVNIAIPERGSFKVSGKLVAHGSRQPVKNAKVLVVRKDNAFSLFDRMSEDGGGATTDDKGTFAFKDLPAGTYIIKIKPPSSYDNTEYDDEGRAKPQGTPKPKFAPTEKEFTIEDKDLSEMTIEMPFGSRIAGAVSVAGNKQLPGSARITAASEKGEQVGTAYISDSDYSDGGKPTPRLTQEFALENIAAGKINLDFTANPFEEDGKNKLIYYLKSISLDSRDLLAAPLEVRENSDVKNVQVLLGADGGRLKAKAKQKDSDEPAANRTVVLIPVEENKWKAKSSRLYAGTDAAGGFEAAGAPAEYFVFFLKSGDKISQINEAWIRERSATAEKITIKPSETVTANLVAP